jgi:DNA-binding MarR family transcriptional regulator
MTSLSGSEDELLLEGQLCFALAAASRAVISAYKPVLQELNLTHPQYLMMVSLWEASPRSVNEISEALLLGQAPVSPLLKRLEASGYVTRRRVQGDERSLAVGLTPEGAALRDRARAVPGTMLGKLGLNRTEAEELHGYMTRLLRSAKTGHAESDDSPDAGQEIAAGGNTSTTTGR